VLLLAGDGGLALGTSAHAAEWRIDHELRATVVAEVMTYRRLSFGNCSMRGAASVFGGSISFPMLVIQHWLPVGAFSSQRVGTHGKFLTMLPAREEPKLRVRNLRVLKRLGICFGEAMVKVLPLAFKIVGSGASAHAARRHLDELGLVLLKPKPEQDEVGALEAEGCRASGAVVEKFAIEQMVEPLNGDVQLSCCLCRGIAILCRSNRPVHR